MRPSSAVAAAAALAVLTGHVGQAVASPEETAALARVAVIGQLLGDDAAAAAHKLLGSAATQDRDREAGAGRGVAERRVPHTAPAARAGHAPAGEPARAELAAADAARSAPSAPGAAAPAIGIGRLEPSLSHGRNLTVAPTPAATDLGPLVCPVAGDNSFIDSFGAPRPGGRAHQGTDLMAEAGTPVVTVAAGVIVKINPVDTPGSLGGITVSYNTRNGDRWYNAHLSAVAAGLATGQHLDSGTTIGYVGTTGDARDTPPHLHIERHPGGDAQAVNAYAALDAACR